MALPTGKLISRTRTNQSDDDVRSRFPRNLIFEILEDGFLLRHGTDQSILDGATWNEVEDISWQEECKVRLTAGERLMNVGSVVLLQVGIVVVLYLLGIKGQGFGSTYDFDWSGGRDIDEPAKLRLHLAGRIIVLDDQFINLRSARQAVGKIA